MSNHWKCPHCMALFTKPEKLEALQSMYQVTGGRISLPSQRCPKCQCELNSAQLFSGRLDHRLMPKPPFESLRQEAADLRSRLSIQVGLEIVRRNGGRPASLCDAEEMLNSVEEEWADFLVDRYGLSVDELFRLRPKDE